MKTKAARRVRLLKTAPRGTLRKSAKNSIQQAKVDMRKAARSTIGRNVIRNAVRNRIAARRKQMEIYELCPEDQARLVRKCFNLECENHNAETFITDSNLIIEPSINHCELFMDITECEMFKGQPEIESLIIHDKCGLPVELCKCEDAPVKYNSETDKFEDRREE